MELNIFALAFTSAMLHPWREFFIKQNKNPEGACLAAMMVWTTLAALHAFIEGIDLFSIQLIWPITLASGLGFICFFIFALRTYRDGDFSSYYPITRADPLFIAIISFLFLGKLYSFILIFGIILVFIGAFFLQYRSGWGILSQPKTLCLAILAMIVHGMVTLMDARAVQVVEPMVQFFWVSLIAVIPLGVIFALNRPKDGHVFEYLFGGWRQTPGSFLMIGASAYVSYFLMLKAFKMVRGRCIEFNPTSFDSNFSPYRRVPFERNKCTEKVKLVFGTGFRDRANHCIRNVYTSGALNNRLVGKK